MIAGPFLLPGFYTLNYSDLERSINDLKDEAFEIKEYSDTHVTGEITVRESGGNPFFKHSP